MKDTRKRRERTVFLLACSALILAAAVSTRYFARLDLTASRAFTLSPAARSLHQSIPERVRITYYISKNLSDKHPGPAAIEDFLRELEAVSRGKITVRTSDPSEDPTEAEGLGVAPQQMQVVERSEQRVALVYTGLVIEYLDRYKVIPAVISTDTLEYEVVKNVRALVDDADPAAGLLVGDADKSVDQDYQTLSAALGKAGYRIVTVQRGTAVPDDVTVLFVLGNAAMDRYDAYFVDQYLMRGGAAFLAVKGVDVNPDYGLAATAVPEGGLLPVLASYGLDVQRQLVLDESCLTVPFQTQGPRGGMSIQYLRYPHWMAVDPRFVDADNPITAKFSGLDLFWPSPIVMKPVDGIEYGTLAKSTPNAWLQATRFMAGPQDAAMFGLERDSTGGQYVVAATAAGSFKSAFSAGDLPAREGAAAVPPPIPSSAPTRVVVVSSADFLTDLMRMSNSVFNVSFAVSAADWLGSGADLIAIRARAETDPRLNRIKDEGTRAFLVTATYAVNLVLIPLAIVLAGAIRAMGRSRRERESRMARGGEA